MPVLYVCLLYLGDDKKKKGFHYERKNRELIWSVSMEIQRSDFQGSACSEPQARFFFFRVNYEDKGSKVTKVCNKLVLSFIFLQLVRRQ